jgi:hypothetical protein
VEDERGGALGQGEVAKLVELGRRRHSWIYADIAAVPTCASPRPRMA